MEKIFVVYCQHNTGHGLSADIVLLTGNFDKAIDTAKEIESLGYEFLHSEPFVVVSEMEIDRVWKKEEMEFVGVPPKDYPAIYVRCFYNKKWREEWFNEKYKNQYLLA